MSAETGGSIHPSSALKIASYFGLEVTDIWPVEQPQPTEKAA